MKKRILALSALVVTFVACSEPAAPVEAEVESPEETVETPEKGGAVIAPAEALLNIYKAPETDAFENAQLALDSRAEVVDGNSAFVFGVSNYDLATQTGDAETRGCANSAKGQHIHFILNNAPYKAHYDAAFQEGVNEGNNVLLAFLSRSYHESIKAPAASVITSFVVGDSSAGPQVDLGKDAIMFYSRPKGTYKSSAGNKVLLDFYLKNCELSASGYAVRATVNDEAWILNEWAAYFIEGLDVGTHTVRLELLDAAGDLVPGVFNDSGVREFTITAD